MKVFVLLTIAVMLMASADVALAGFGCPWNRYQCHSHCRSIGRLGGYCAGRLGWTCTCYRSKK
ncbi:defensin-1 isoform X2 [Crassostrea virginica]